MKNQEFYGFVYLTTNLTNNKKYVGMHNGKNNLYYGSNKELKEDVKILGRENFTREILYETNNPEDLINKEIEYIINFNAVENPNFYNKTSKKQGGWYSLTDEQKHEVRSLLSREGKTKWENYSEETKNSITCNLIHGYGKDNTNYGNKWTKEQKENLSEIKKSLKLHNGEKNGMYGKKGKEALNGKKIYMYNENYELIKEFNTKLLAMEFLKTKGHTALLKALRTGKLYRNYYWYSKKIEEGLETIENTRGNLGSE